MHVRMNDAELAKHLCLPLEDSVDMDWSELSVWFPFKQIISKVMDLTLLYIYMCMTYMYRLLSYNTEAMELIKDQNKW